MYRSNIKTVFTGMNFSPAILFMNSNKSERNLQGIVKETRQNCRPYGIELQHDCIVNKGPNRDIDRDAINMLISMLITGRYEVVIVNKMTDLTDDLSDLNEFMKNAFFMGIYFFELSTMKYHFNSYFEGDCYKGRPIWSDVLGIVL